MIEIVRYGIVSERWGTSFKSRLVPTSCGEYMKHKDFERIDAECNALRDKLARVLAMLEPDGPPIPGGMFDKENRFYYRYGKALHARAVAIAEGRDDD